MLTISRMKTLISSSLSSSSLLLPKSSPSALFYASRISFLCQSHTSTVPNSPLSRLQPHSPTPPILAIPNRKLQAKASLSSSSCGEVHVIVGPMFSGKTTTLLRRVEAEMNNGRSAAIIKSNKDTRYGLDSIVTHDGVKLPCSALGSLLAFKQRVGVHAYDQLDVIGIDEAQFFEDLYDFCREAADHDGKTVIVAGLDGDYLRRSFGSVLDIIPLANSVTKLAARCEICGNKAFFTLRKTDEMQKELVGGADIYMPVCRQHYVDVQLVKEARRAVLESQKLRCGSIP